MAGYGNRDAAIAEYYETLYKAGEVEESFQLYGCAYWLDGETGCYVTEREEKIFAFRTACEANNGYCTPIQLKTFWTKVQMGSRQKLKRQYQLAFAKELAEGYSKDFFDTIALLRKRERKPLGETFIKAWNDRLDLVTETTELELFDNTIAKLVQRKLLTAETAKTCCKHSEAIRQFMRRDEVKPIGKEHKYAGFCSMDESGHLEYHRFAGYHTAWKAYQEAESEQKVLSPIITKTDYFDPVDYRIVQEHKDAFHRLIRDTVNETYMRELEEILSAGGIAIEAEEWAQLESNIKIFRDWEQKAFQLYLAESGITIGP